MIPTFELTDSLSPSLVIQGKELILAAGRVVEVTGEAQHSLAAQVGRALHVHLQEVEAERKRLVRPAVDFQRIINTLADDHCEPLDKEKKRIKKLLEDFDEKEQARVKALKEAQSAEFQRLEVERQNLLNLSKGAGSLSASIAAEQRAVALDQTMREILLAPAYALRAGGMRVKPEDTDFEIVDLHAAVRARPDLFKIEPRASLIKDLPLDANIPGIRLFTKTSVNFVK